MIKTSRLYIVLYASLFLMYMLSGCSRGDVPLPSMPPTEEPTIVESTEVIPTPTQAPLQNYSVEKEYAAVWVLKEEGLHVRNPAGISGSIVEDLPWNARQIFLTDNRSLLGSSLWVEILTNGDLTGWVNAWYITEFVPSDAFCTDDRILPLFNQFLEFVKNPLDPSIETIVSPNHGLAVRHNWYNPDVIFESEDILNRFSDVGEINWGVMADSGIETIGTFADVILPKLDDVFLNQSEILCNELRWGNTSGEVRWPDEFQNLNFYTFYRPAPEDGIPFDWRTWAIGVEYVGGQPFITVLIHYSSEL